MKSSYYIIKFDYKARLDSIYVNILGKTDETDSLQVSENVMVDLNAEKIPVRFRIIDVSNVFQEKKSFLKNIKDVDIDFEVDKESIHFRGRFEFEIDNNVFEKNIDVDAPNDFKMQDMKGNYKAGMTF